MSIKSDRWIRRMAHEKHMIDPFVDAQVRAVDAQGRKVISYGVSSYGYDMRVAPEFKIFTNVLSAIVDQVGETAVMIVRVGTRALCLRRAEPDKALKYTFAVNQLLPLHAGAGQRTLLAWAPDAVIDQVLRSELERFTDRTPTAAELRQSLPAVRRVGWALSRGEFDAGSVSVAVPVLFGGEAVCSLNVAGPESRCGSREWVKNTVQMLHSAAADLADALGASARNTTKEIA